jgi:hypothetical protein
MLLSGATAGGGEKGNGGNMKQTTLVSLFNTKTLKPAVYPDSSFVYTFFVNSRRYKAPQI